MTKRTGSILLAAWAAAALSGCGVGYNRVLFVTRTNVGFAVDSKPATVELDIDRLEGVFAPQFEEGKKLPVMASFRFQSKEALSTYFGSAFATGDAARTLACLYDAPTVGGSGGWEDRDRHLRGQGADGASPFDSGLVLARRPTVDNDLVKAFCEKGPDGDAFQQSDVRPVFFGTDTSFGIKVAWSGLTAHVPDTVRVGYMRKELAWVPVTLRERAAPDPKDPNEFVVKTSSLLATVDAGAEVKAALEVPVDYIQYFATGEAATFLAMQQDVRRAMLARLDPHREAYATLFAGGMRGAQVIRSLGILISVHKALRDRKADTRAQTIADNLDKLGLATPDRVVKHLWRPRRLKEIDKDGKKDKVVLPLLKLQTVSLTGKGAPTGLQRATTYWNALRVSRDDLLAVRQTDEWRKGGLAFEIQEDKAAARALKAGEKEEILGRYEKAGDTFDAFDKFLRGHPAVAEAMRYYYQILMP